MPEDFTRSFWSSCGPSGCMRDAPALESDVSRVRYSNNKEDVHVTYESGSQPPSDTTLVPAPDNLPADALDRLADWAIAKLIVRRLGDPVFPKQVVASSSLVTRSTCLSASNSFH